MLQTLTTIHTQGQYQEGYLEQLTGINYPVTLELMKRDFEETLLRLPEDDDGWQQGLLDLVQLHLDAFRTELGEFYKDSRAAGGGATTEGGSRDEIKRALVSRLLLSKDKEIIEPRYKQTCRFVFNHAPSSFSPLLVCRASASVACCSSHFPIPVFKTTEALTPAVNKYSHDLYRNELWVLFKRWVGSADYIIEGAKTVHFHPNTQT